MMKELQNKTLEVSLHVEVANNEMSVFLNPDLDPENKINYLTTTVYHTRNYDVVKPSEDCVVISLAPYLGSYAQANPNATAVKLAVVRTNYRGPGRQKYHLKGKGVPVPISVDDEVPEWTSRMDVYTIKLKF